MSFEPDSEEHEREVESNFEQMIKRLDAIIFLLEIVTNTEHSATEDLMGD